MKTVGELKEFIKKLDDNMPLVKRSNNFELRGEIDLGVSLSVEKFKIECKEFMDGFDYEIYHHNVYVHDNNGQECLQIN